jgi:hypothetical protein
MLWVGCITSYKIRVFAFQQLLFLWGATHRRIGDVDCGAIYVDGCAKVVEGEESPR